MKLDSFDEDCPKESKQSYNQEHNQEGSFSSTNVQPMYLFHLAIEPFIVLSSHVDMCSSYFVLA